MVLSHSVLLIVLLMLGRSLAAYEVLKAPDGTSATLSSLFGCSITSSSSHLSVFSLSSPFSDGRSAWRTFSYTQTTGNQSWNLKSTLIPEFSSLSEPTPGTAPCIMDSNSGYVVIGEPWANNGAGRVIISKIDSSSSNPPSLVLGSGQFPRDAFGSDVAIYNEWAVASAPSSASKYIRLYRYQNSQYSFHSEITGSSIEGTGVDSMRVVFGAWIDIRNDWLAIGAPSESGVGAVFLFKYSTASNAWALFQTLLPTEDSKGGDDTSFGSVVSLRGNRLFVSAPGSSTSSGSVYVYRFGLHGEWEIEKLLKSDRPERADDFGRAISATDYTLAISQASTTRTQHSMVHVYRQCGSVNYALHQRLIPEEGERLLHAWGQRLAWNLDALAIASTGLVNIWRIPGASQCQANVGAFPAASCCDQGSNVIADSSGTIHVRGADTSLASFIETPIIVAGNLVVEPSSIIAIKQGSSVAIDGEASLAGKLKVEMARPTSEGANTIYIDNIVRFSSRKASFQDVEVVFASGQTKCDRISVQPVYSSDSLSLIVNAFVATKCKSSNRLIPVYAAIACICVSLVIVLLAIWKFPRLRDMIVRPYRAEKKKPLSEYKHKRLATDENEEGNMDTIYEDHDDDRISIGAHSDSEDDHDEDFI